MSQNLSDSPSGRPSPRHATRRLSSRRCRRAPTAALAFAFLFAVAAAAGAGAVQAADGVPDDLAAPPADAERTPSGLASKVLAPGTGEARPDANDLVRVHFTGWTPGGVKFESSHDRGEPAVFNLETVFPGWREAMQLMTVGEKRRVWIPAHLTPENPASGPEGDVVFDIEMLSFKRIPNPPEDLSAPPEDAERTPSGALTRRLETGWGDERPAADSSVMLHYIGWTTDGKTFDSSVARGRPTMFPLGKVLAPFAEAVQLMVEGEKRRVWIPGNVAAGQWTGSPEGDLVFEVKLLSILPEGSVTSGKIEKPGTGKPGTD